MRRRARSIASTGCAHNSSKRLLHFFTPMFNFVLYKLLLNRIDTATSCTLEAPGPFVESPLLIIHGGADRSFMVASVSVFFSYLSCFAVYFTFLTCIKISSFSNFFITGRIFKDTCRIDIAFAMYEYSNRLLMLVIEYSFFVIECNLILFLHWLLIHYILCSPFT